MHLQTEQYILWSYNTSIFNAVHFDENLVHMLVRKSKEKGFQIWHFYWSFSNEIMAVSPTQPPAAEWVKADCFVIVLFVCFVSFLYVLLGPE